MMKCPIQKCAAALPRRCAAALLAFVVSVATGAEMDAGVGAAAADTSPPVSTAEQALLEMTSDREALLPLRGSRTPNGRRLDSRGRPVDIVGQHSWRMQQQLRRRGLDGVPVIEVR